MSEGMEMSGRSDVKEKEKERERAIEGSIVGSASRAVTATPQTTLRPGQHWGLRLEMPDGHVAAMKWMALVLMTLDHVNKYLLQGQVAWMFAAGRVVMPLFSFVLAYNLARPEAQPSASGPGAAERVARRLLCFAVISTPMSWALMGPWPLNILFMLASAAWIIALLQRGRPSMAVLIGLLSGFLVEFWWPAIAATVAAWFMCRGSSRRAWLAWIGCLWLLTLINGNLWAFAVIPLIASLASVRRAGWLTVPRAKWLFYGYYPGHLLVLWGCLIWR